MFYILNGRAIVAEPSLEVLVSTFQPTEQKYSHFWCHGVELGDDGPLEIHGHVGALDSIAIIRHHSRSCGFE